MIGITLTGADERTKLFDVMRLVKMGAEIGLLYTHSPDGRNRYPSLAWIVAAIEACRGSQPRGPVAIHVCGNRAKQALYRGDLDMYLERAARIQINGAVSNAELLMVCKAFPRHEIITQTNPANADLLGVDVANHSILVDASGGCGKLPNSWMRPNTTKKVGFAGGLGPSTLRKQLPKIATAAQGSWWVDMEGRLRDAADWFDIEQAMQVMMIWQSWLSMSEIGRKGG